MKMLRPRMFVLTSVLIFGLANSFRKLVNSKVSFQNMKPSDVLTVESSKYEVRAVNPHLETVIETNLSDDRSGVNLMYSLSVDNVGLETVEVLGARLLQRTDGPVPRSHLPTLMVIDEVETHREADAAAVFAIIEEGAKWYFDAGGRASKLEISCSLAISAILRSIGFEPAKESKDDDVLHLRSLDVREDDGRVILNCNPKVFKDFCQARTLEADANLYRLYDIMGRLSHDLGDPQGAIKLYTSSLQINSKSAATFRNMGSAYHAVGDLKLAFASYQQAIQLDEKGAPELM